MKHQLGEKNPNYRHGLKRHREYSTWVNMLARCENPSHPLYPNWGARGITVSEEFHDPRVFLEYLDTVLGPRPERYDLDRIDNDAGYMRGNLRWATRSQNLANRRAPTDHRGLTLMPNGRWRARIKRHGVTRYLGTFDTEEEAAAAYRAAAEEDY